MFFELRALIRLIFECAEGGSNANKPPRADRRPGLTPTPIPSIYIFLGKGGVRPSLSCACFWQRGHRIYLKFCGQARKRGRAFVMPCAAWLEC